MIVNLDPRDSDHPRSLERHRPDLPTSDKQVDALWSFAEQPGGWYAPPPTAAVPELSTWAMFALGFLFLVRRTNREYQRHLARRNVRL